MSQHLIIYSVLLFKETMDGVEDTTTETSVSEKVKKLQGAASSPSTDKPHSDKQLSRQTEPS